MKKQKQVLVRPTRSRGATSSHLDKNNKIPGSSYIYDGEDPIASSLGLIILCRQCTGLVWDTNMAAFSLV